MKPTKKIQDILSIQAIFTIYMKEIFAVMGKLISGSGFEKIISNRGYVI